MPRRTGVDTLFDNLDVPSPAELQAMANENVLPADYDPMDAEDVNQATEGEPGKFGSFGEGDRKTAAEPREEMDPEEYETAIGKAISAAENYIDMEVSPDRELAAKYYRGDLFGNEEDGRSQVVMTEVRDTVLSMMPALLRIFCGTADAVEFLNNEGTPVEQAKNATAYVNHIVHNDNPGFTILHSAFKDALVRRTGVLTWWHEEKETVTSEIITGVNEEAFALLQMEAKESSSEDENIEVNVVVLDQREDTTATGAAPDLLDDGTPLQPQDPNNPNPEPPPVNYIRDVRLDRRVIKKRHRVQAVPPEEFIVTPIASDDLDEYPLVGRRQMKTIGELVALGHSEEDIREAIGGAGGGRDSALRDNPERVDRDGALIERIFDTGFEAVDESSEYVKYCVVYVLIDKEGDGIPKRRKICTVGDNNKIIHDALSDEMVPFGLLCPDPEPHSPFGYSVADQAMDIQETKSEIARGILDSLAESIVGRTAIIEGKVNIDDALSNDRDQLIRTKEAGSIWSLSKPFSGMNAIPVLQYLDDVKARRTGVTMAPAGLSADTLQSTATDAVQATVDASQERTEMIARIFAETGIKRLFRGLLQNVVRHQDRKRMIRLRGKPITVDPRSFVADLDLETNVGLGRGTGAKKIAALEMIIARQIDTMDKYGPTQPMVGLHHISNAMEDLVREIGFNDVSRYMHVITEDENKAYMEAQAQIPKPPTPEELMYKAQSEKTAADAENKRRSDMIRFTIAMMQDKTKQERDDMDFYARAAEILGKFGISISEQDLKREMADNQQADGMAQDAIAHGQNQVAQLQGPATGGQGGV